MLLSADSLCHGNIATRSASGWPDRHAALAGARRGSRVLEMYNQIRHTALARLQREAAQLGANSGWM